MQDKYISVTQLTKYIKYKIDTDHNLTQVFLRGEISNFKAHTRGHYYFTLKDETSRINAVMFSSSVAKCPFRPQDGMKVLITGKISVYEATGGYQIYVNSMLEDGVGNLYVAFEQLKEKLAEEGLFAESQKKPIPKFPETIGIITAPTGAAIRDILSTIKRRWPLAHTILFPSLVQGASAAPDIVKQIELATTYPLDLLIIGRGGGSIEDMWCFNDENVARAIYHCFIPTISAVGHEIDFTIADFVADLRAPTPTGAAEMAVPNYLDILTLIEQMSLRLKKAITNQININYQKLNQIKNIYILKNPLSMYEVKEQKLDSLLERTIQSMKHRLKEADERLKKSCASYILLHPEKIYLEKGRDFDRVYQLFQQQIKSTYQQFVAPYNELLSKLEALNPLLTMKRGYTITKQNGRVISSKKMIDTKEMLSLDFHDGTVKAKIVE